MSDKDIKVAVIIAAGGKGVRMRSNVPKQFLHLHDTPIVIHTVKKFAGYSEIQKIILVVPENELAETELLIYKWNISEKVEVIIGGETRQHSVWQGLNHLPDKTEIVMVHDGVRPFISEEIIDTCIREAGEWGAVITAVPISDTVKEVIDHTVKTTLDRSILWRVQTPQCFQKRLLIEAYKKAWEENRTATDDSTLVEQLGQTVRVVQGDERNIKITSPEDLKIAEKLLEEK